MIDRALTVRWRESPLRRSADDNARARSDSREQPGQCRVLERDAARGWREPWPRDVDEDRAAAAGDARPAVVVDFNDEVVERVLPPQPVGAAALWNSDRPIVGPVARVFAPAVVRSDSPCWQEGPRLRSPVGTPPQPDRAEMAARGAAIAFALVGSDSTAAERHRQGQRACERYSPLAVARLRPHAQEVNRRPKHRLTVALLPPNALVRPIPPGYIGLGLWIMPNTRKILIVDDDTELRTALVEQLALHDEFEAEAVENGTKGVQAAKSGQIDLVIMDVGLPDIDGREAVRILRKNGFKAPIIMLTGHDTDSDTILGLESGANDYVTKPFRFAVLLARIRAQLRQHEASEDAVFTIGPYTFRPSSKLLMNPKGGKVRLTEKETAILRYLYRAGQRPVSRETLLQEVWGYNSGVTTHTLETHVYRLRQKVEKDAANPTILVTDAGGYKLVP